MEVMKAVAERRRTHDDVMLLCVGQPSTPAPAPALAAAQAALGADSLGYTEAVGLRPLRERLARYYADTYDVDVDPDALIITTGSSAGFQLALLAAFDAGDTVVMARPGYPAYRNDLVALGCRVVDLECGPETRFQPTVAMMEALPEVPQGLVVASPSNPTGTIIDPDELAALARWCAAHDCLLLSDEIYHGISFGRRTASAWEFAPQHSVVVGSVSKYWSMTGWRLGWLLLPDALRRPVELLQGNLAICAPTLSQVAAIAALEPDARAEMDAHVVRYAAVLVLTYLSYSVLSVLHQITPSARQGEAMALRVMTINFSSFLMPMLFGSVGAVTGMAGLFWLVGGALALGARAVPGLRLPSPHP